MLVATQYPTETGAVATLENSVRESRKHSILFIATQSFGFLLIRQTTIMIKIEMRIVKIKTGLSIC